MDYVNTFSVFNRLSIKYKFAPHLRAYYLLRYHNSESNGGSGWLPMREVKTVLTKYWTQNRVRDILNFGYGKFWETSGDGIVLFKVERLARVLRKNPGHRVSIPLAAFDSLGKFKAYAYATFFAKASNSNSGLKGKSISRKILTELFGISDSTQKRYEKIASIKVEPQHGFRPIPNFNSETMSYINENDAILKARDGLEPGNWIYDADGDGKPEIVQQLSNNYSVATVKYKFNENRRVFKVGGDENRDVAKPRLRRYHTHAKSLKNMLKRSKNEIPGYLFDKKSSEKQRRRLFKIIRF